MEFQSENLSIVCGSMLFSLVHTMGQLPWVLPTGYGVLGYSLKIVLLFLHSHDKTSCCRLF